MSRKDNLPKCAQELARDVKDLWIQYGKYNRRSNPNGPFKSQIQLAAKLVASYGGRQGVTQSSVSQFFNHHMEIPRGQLVQLLRLCNVPQGAANQLFETHKEALGFRRLDYKMIDDTERNIPGSLVDPIEHAAYVQGSMDMYDQITSGRGGLLCRRLVAIIDEGHTPQDIIAALKWFKPW